MNSITKKMLYTFILLLFNIAEQQIFDSSKSTDPKSIGNIFNTKSNAHIVNKPWIEGLAVATETVECDAK